MKRSFPVVQFHRPSLWCLKFFSEPLSEVGYRSSCPPFFFLRFALSCAWSSWRNKIDAFLMWFWLSSSSLSPYCQIEYKKKVSTKKIKSKSFVFDSNFNRSTIFNNLLIWIIFIDVLFAILIVLQFRSFWCWKISKKHIKK